MSEDHVLPGPQTIAMKIPAEGVSRLVAAKMFKELSLRDGWDVIEINDVQVSWDGQNWLVTGTAIGPWSAQTAWPTPTWPKGNE